MTYQASDCLKNIETGDSLIIGRQTDVFPASDNLPESVELGLLITGRDVNGNPLLRTVEFLKTGNKTTSYQLVHKNDVAVLSIWKSAGVEKGHPYTVETIDAKDWTVNSPHLQNRRNVTVTLEAGGFRRVLVRGYHTKQ